MAKTSDKKPEDINSAYESQYKKDFTSDFAIHKNYVNQNFDAWESMLTGTVFDSVSGTVDESKISDSYATTLSKERSDRVMAKLPEGQTMPMGKADMGKAAFMDILRQKWIYPNANAQHPLAEKFNMWDFYSGVYGYMPMFYDWNVASSGYSGPDCWLWDPRKLIPQQGRASIKEMEHVTALTYVNRSYLEGILEENDPSDAKEDSTEGETDDHNPSNDGGWDYDAIKELLENDESHVPMDITLDSQVTRTRTTSMSNRGIMLATRYEAGEDGEWVTFAPEHGYCEIRRLKNPHKNGRIPFVIKYSQPLFDSFYGLGDFQRAKPLMFARDGLTNFYFSGIKMNLIPPIVANANGVVKHTLDYRPGGVILETLPNSVRRLETSTAGLSTYQAAQQALTGSLLAQFGSQNADATGAQSNDPSQGRTPAAINLYSDKEATRDGAARRHLESAIEELTEGFFSLVVNIGSDKVPVTLLKEDIMDIVKSGLKDITGLFTSKNLKKGEDGLSAKLVIDPKQLQGVEYRFKIQPDSTAKINKQSQLQALLDMIDRLGKYQNILQEDPTITIHWDKIMTAYMGLTDIPAADEFITFDPQAQPPPQPPSATSVQSPGGQVHETADLGKLYVSTNDVGIKKQIMVAMGFQPTMDDVSPDHLSAMSNLLASAQGQPAPEPPQIHVSKSGHSFHDPHLKDVSDAIHEMAQPIKGQGPQPKEPTPAPTQAPSGGK